MDSSNAPSSIYKSANGYDAIMGWYDHQLERLSVDTESLWVDTHAGRTHLLAAGPPDAPPVFLLHGMNLNAAAMTTGIYSLASIRRVYAVDIIGMPGKSAGTRPSRTGDAYPRWLDDVVSALDVDRASFIGQSFGGWIILKLAAQRPDRFRSMALLGSGGLVPFTIWGQMRAGIAALWYMLWSTKSNLKRAVAPLYGPEVSPPPDLMTLLGLTFRHMEMDVDLNGLPRPNRKNLASLEAPVFMSYGAHDIFFAPHTAIENADDLWPHSATTEIVADEGHLFSREGEQNLFGRIATFLKEHE